jgi:glycogenin glucosyltransferase
VCFLDCDVLILKNIDDIFTYIENEQTIFSAAPDIGWPDAFNTGVFVTKPSSGLHESVLGHSLTVGSFDGIYNF